jgi:hypothetical protein
MYEIHAQYNWMFPLHMLFFRIISIYIYGPTPARNKGMHALSTSQSLKMELIEGSETSANYNLTPGKHPKEQIHYRFHIGLITYIY